MTLFSDILSIPSNPEDFFTLISLIGSGAFGKVYKARHNESKKLYAIKIIQYFKDNSNYTDNNMHIDNINFCYKTVQKETSLMRLINSSEYILKYYGSYFSRKSNSLWLILEYCSSGSAIDLMLAMDRTYSEIELATIIKMILKGLVIIHDKNLIHRDIKGANILLSEEGYAKLGDFGVGAELKEKYRNSKKGSPYWMSPQVIKKEKYDCKADIWSLGITCIELLQGEPPNSELSPEGVMKKIGNKSFKFDEFFRGNKDKYSKEFQNFLNRCLDVNPLSRANSKELLNHPFIVKFSKDNLFLKELFIKHRNDIDLYRKEVEDFENQLKEKQRDKNKSIINNNIIKKYKFYDSFKRIKENNNQNDSFFYLKINNHEIVPGNLNLLNYFSSNSKNKRNNYLGKKKNTINTALKNNSYNDLSKKIKIKSRNLEKNLSKEQNNRNKIYYTKNEFLSIKKCQIISFRMPMKKSISEKKNKKSKNNSFIYNRKIVLNKGKNKNDKKNKFKAINKIKSCENIKINNSNINGNNLDNFYSSNNSSFILNSLSLKNVYNKNRIKIKNLKLGIQTFSKIENNKNNLYSCLDTDSSAINDCTISINGISTQINNIIQMDEIPCFDKILNKEENINDEDDDCLINKINEYKLKVNGYQNKENKNMLNINKINYINKTDSIHSYSIIDSKDSVISIMPIHSTNNYLNETKKSYFN